MPSPEFESPARRSAATEKPAAETLLSAHEPGFDPESWFTSFSRARLRARYQLPRRLMSMVVAFAPWFDVLLLGTAIVLFQNASAMIPGQPVALPAATFRDGARSTLSVVVNALPATASQPVLDPAAAPVTVSIPAVAWFRDERFLLNQPHRIAALRAALTEARVRNREDTLLLYLDRELSAENLLRVSAIARDAGFAHVSLVTRH